MQTAFAKHRANRFLGWLAAISVVASGCSGKGSASGGEEQTTAAMRLLGMQYAAYLGAHNNSPPKDEAAMREWLEAHMDELQPYGVKAVDDLLKSSRDGQPLVIVYAKTIADPSQPDMAWAAYEQTGDGSTRLAVNVRGAVAKLTPEEFAKMVPAK